MKNNQLVEVASSLVQESKGAITVGDPIWIPGQDGIVSAGAAIRAQTYSNPVQHPLNAPTVTGTTMTVDMALKSPTRVTRTLMDLTLQRFFADRVFANGGGVTGGAVVYDELIANDLYLDRDIDRVAPGDEFPEVVSSRRAPVVAEVEKWGAKFWVSIESRDRNDTSVFARNVQQMANTITRKINMRAVEVLEAAVQKSPNRLVTGNSWGAVVTAGSGASNSNVWPGYDMARAQMLAEQDELGIVYNLWILNPTEYLQLARIYGSGLNDLLASLGISIFVTNRITAGTAYVVQERAPGQMRIEQPLATEQWYQEENQRYWTQSSVRPLFFVDNRFAVQKWQGLT